MIPPDETQGPESANPVDVTGSFRSGGTSMELAEILERYMEDLQAGKSVARSDLLARHPDLAEKLGSYLAGIEFIHRAAAPIAEREQGLTGPLVLGDFQIFREVGRGGMGVVYEAEQLSLKRRVALKVLRFGSADDEGTLSRFEREAQTVAALHHTNIVPIHAIGSENGVSYYAMQFIEGKSLSGVLGESVKENRPLDFEEVAGWGMQAAEALAHAHQRGVIHRDVKPSNLLVDADGTIWLTDFGLAKRADEVTLTLSGAIMGTPRYMSPEQAEAFKRPVDERTDIYSLGASLYELATGKPLFDSESPHHVIQKILTDEPIAPRLVRKGFPKDLETILQTCLAKDPAKRYASARELAADLRAFLDGRPIRARRVHPLERVLRQARKRKKAIAVALVAAVASPLVVAGAAFGLVLYQRSRLGEIVLATEGEALTGRWLDANDEPIGEEFAIGAKTVLSVDEGDHRLIVSAKGMPSETMNVASVRRTSQAFKIGLGESMMWKDNPPPRTRLAWTPKLYSYSSLITFGGDVQWPGTGLRRYDGLSGKEIWKVETRGKGNQGADALLFAMSAMGNPPFLIENEKIDLDGDGAGDLVFAGDPAVAAISSKDGRFLWWTYVDPKTNKLSDPQSEFREPAGGFPAGRALGPPLAAEIDGDGALDVIAHLRGADGSTQAVALSGKSGRAVWSRPLGPAPDLELTWIEHKEGKLIGLIAAGQWLALDPTTGATRIGPVDLGEHGDPLSMRIDDLNGDGVADLLALSKSSDAKKWNLAAVSLADGKPMWSVPIRQEIRGDDQTPRETWPVVVHQGAGSGSAILVPDISHDDHRIEILEAVLLDGKTGRTLWRRPLGRTSELGSSIRLMSAGPDLDGDGRRDFAVGTQAFILNSTNDDLSNQKNNRAYIDALSGKDGHSLWFTSARTWNWNQSVVSLDWIGDREPALAAVVGAHYSHRMTGVNDLPEATTLIIAGATGRKLATIEGMNRVRPATLGDNISPAIVGVTERGWAALRHDECETWRSIGEWIPARDYDGDGVTDVIGPANRVQPHPQFQSASLCARSGFDGRLLWSSSSPLESGPRDAAGKPVQAPLTVLELSGPGGDLDRDGVVDLAVMPGNWNEVREPGAQLPLAAVSGKTGLRIWSAQGFTSTHEYALTTERQAWVAADTTRDGIDDINVVHRFAIYDTKAARTHAIHWLTSVDGRSGAVVWNRELARRHAAIMNWGDSRLVAANLDGDAALDFAVSYEANRSGGGQGIDLSGVSGRDGRVLWTHAFKTPGIPVFASGDMDGDGRDEIAFAEWTGAPSDGNATNLTVALLDGASGNPLWKKTPGASAMNGPYLPPLKFARIDTGGKPARLLATIVREPKAPSESLIVFDSKGVILRSVSLNSIGVHLWASGDIDNDGFDEFLYYWSGGLLKASTGDLASELWKATRRSGNASPRVLGNPGRVILRESECLDGKSGKLLWSTSFAHHAVDVETRPWVISGSQGSNVGRGLVAGDRIAGPPDSPVDPRTKVALPWARSVTLRESVENFAQSAIVAFGLLVVPLWLVRYAWRKRGMSMMFLVAMIFCLGYMFGTEPWFAKLLPNMRRGSRLFSLLQTLAVGSVIGLPTLRFLKACLVWSLHRRKLIWLGLAAVAVAAALTAIALIADRSSKAPFEVYDWSRGFDILVYAVWPVGLGLLAYSVGRSAGMFVRERILRRKPA